MLEKSRLKKKLGFLRKCQFLIIRTADFDEKIGTEIMEKYSTKEVFLTER